MTGYDVGDAVIGEGSGDGVTVVAGLELRSHTVKPVVTNGVSVFCLLKVGGGSEQWLWSDRW